MIVIDNAKTGRLIYALRKEKQLTQLQLARMMNISDKTVSKWERGLGCPDISLLPQLAQILEIDIAGLLSGELEENRYLGGNMKKLQFYICPQCGNLLTALNPAAITCCGKILKPCQPQKAEEQDKLTVEIIENQLFLSSSHPMEKDHYIAFVALLTGDTLVLKKQYPEWDLQIRLSQARHGKLLWYCTQHGLFYQLV